MMTTLTLVLPALLSWMVSAQGSNVTFAAICALSLCGVPMRWVVVLTIILHLCLAVTGGRALIAF